MSDFIIFDNVTYSYEDDEQSLDETIEKAGKVQNPAIENVSFTVAQGDFVCIIGRNGSGKSTIARLMNALILPSEGTVFVDAMDILDEKNVKPVRREVGMVFQNPDNQIIGTSIEEDVAFGPENLGIERSEMIIRVKDAINGCGLGGLETTEPHLLSGGQKQRVAIAGILAMKPKCIVLDESTAMLDPKGRRDVLGIVRKLNKEEKITIVLITHHMDEIVDSDEVILVNKGHVIKEGSPRELFADNDLLKEAGLGLPPTANLFNELKNEGFNIENPVLTVEEGVDFISGRIKA